MVGLFELLYGAALLCLDVGSHFKITITALFCLLPSRPEGWVRRRCSSSKRLSLAAAQLKLELHLVLQGQQHARALWLLAWQAPMASSLGTTAFLPMGGALHLK